MNPSNCLNYDESSRVETIISSGAMEALARIGRTEDVRFSPDNRRLVVAGFLENACFIFDVEIDRAGGTPVIKIYDFMELRSHTLKQPHGLDFIDNSTLVVANREGAVTVFKIPEHRLLDRIHNIDPIRTVGTVGYGKKIRWPGSVCIAKANKNRVEILVCNNYWHRVTRHVFGIKRGFSIPWNNTFLKDGLSTPDGIAISRDNSWIAVSNHGTNDVAIYATGEKLNRYSEPCGILSGVAFPHGLRFSPDSRKLFVADAGAPLICQFEAPDGDWRGNRDPVVSAAVLDEATFIKGHVNPQEGGPKGLDLDAEAEVMAVTCSEQALAFFHVGALFG